MHHNTVGYAIAMMIISILFLIYGYDILKNGYKNLIHVMPNMDTLVSLGVVSSFAYSVYEMISITKGNMVSVSNLYFESAAIVIYFVKLGRYIDGISTGKTKDAVPMLM